MDRPNTANKHLIAAIDWKKYSATEWVEQFGAWVNTDNPTSMTYTHPLAAMIDKADTKRIRKSSIHVACQITDDEARAVQRILLDMMDNIDLDVSKWAWVLIQRYELRLSFGIIANLNNWSKTTVQRMANKGLEHFSKIILPVN